MQVSGKGGTWRGNMRTNGAEIRREEVYKWEGNERI